MSLAARRVMLMTQKDTGVTWQSYVDFSKLPDDASPAGDHAGTAGRYLLTDTGGNAAIASGYLRMTGKGAHGDPAVWLGGNSGGSISALTFGAGTIFAVRGRRSHASHRYRSGFDLDTTLTFLNPMWLTYTASVLRVVQSTGQFSVGTNNVNTWTTLSIVQLNTGHAFIQDGRLLWIDSAAQTATGYAATASYTASYHEDVTLMAVGNLTTNNYPAAATAYGLSRSREATPIAGQTQACDPDSLINLESVTLPSSGSVDFKFRIVDATNYCILSLVSDGSCTLKEVVAGTPSAALISGAAATVTTGDRVVINADGADGRLYCDTTTEVGATSSITVVAGDTAETDALGTGGAISAVTCYDKDQSANLPAEAV